MAHDVVDLFAGPGGWSVALDRLGFTEYGIEKEDWACITAQSAGWHREQALVENVMPSAGADQLKGLVASPPCGDIANCGPGTGRSELDWVCGVVGFLTKGRGILDWSIAYVREEAQSPLTHLLLEPLRYIRDLGPEWVCFEQVQAVLPVWTAMRPLLERWGYHVWTGELRAEQFGVPQTRTRAILIASRAGEVTAPPVTHSKYHRLDPRRLDDGVKPWVSMGEALGRAPASILRSSYGSNRAKDERGVREGWQPAPTITSKFSSARWHDGKRMTQQEAALLQTFPADYPWAGENPDRARQVANAIPPVLAEAIIRAAVA